MVSAFLGVPWGEPILKYIRRRGSKEVLEEIEDEHGHRISCGSAGGRRLQRRMSQIEQDTRS
ncbi:hypothetical protein BIW11_08492, partial [Tropilaelaps mercedesae]